jgi:predicted ATPase
MNTSSNLHPITQFEIENYKSLDRVCVDLHPEITIFVGQTASGKSNLVDALHFLRDVSFGKLDQAVLSRGGISRIRQSSKNRTSPIRLKIVGKTSEIKNDDFYYSFDLKPSSDGRYSLQNERVNSDWVKSIPKKWIFSSLDPKVMRQLGIKNYSNNLKEDISNWASFIRTSIKMPHGQKMLDRVVEIMKVMLPDFQGVTVSTAGSYLVPYFHFSNQNGKSHFDPVQLSDGTLRIFGLLLSLYQCPPPSLIVIEEPEQFIHPSVLAMLVDVFKEVSEVTQLIITTHSPHLLEHFSPEHIRVVSIVNGLTQIDSLRTSHD